MSIAEIREAVKQELLNALAPLSKNSSISNSLTSLTTPAYATAQKGWPLRKPVTAKELLAVASRVSGVLLVNDVLIAEGDRPSAPQIPINGLELPRVLGISVTIGDPMDMGQLRGDATAPKPGAKPTPKIVPVPVIPEEC